MHNHGLQFEIEGVVVTVDEVAEYIAARVECDSERLQEELAHDVAHWTMEVVGRKILMAKARAESARIRTDWIRRHPPNHAGYYYCHICGGWVHIDAMELDHVKPKSVLSNGDPNRDDNLRPSHAWPIIGPSGKTICQGNRVKGSSTVESATMEITPPDGEI